MEKSANRIIAVVLVGFLAFFCLYLLFLPGFEPSFEKAPALHFTMLLYALLSVLALTAIDKRRLHARHLLCAGGLGLLSVAVFLPREGNTLDFHLLGLTPFAVVTANLLTGVTVALVFLLVLSLASDHDIQKTLIRPFTAKNMLVYFGILCAFVLVYWALTKFRAPGAITLLDIPGCIGAGVSEEVILRLLPFAFALFLGGGKSGSKPLTFLLMTIPFTLLHFFDEFLFAGFIATLPALIQFWIVAAVPMTLLFWKRDLFTAISVHVLWDVLATLFA